MRSDDTKRVSKSVQTSPRSRLKRHPERGSGDLERIAEILDAAKICHVGWIDEGRPIVLPTAFGRLDDSVILHGAAEGRFMKALAGGAEVCVTVTLLDGLVLARSAFHSSMNYRSVVIFGRATPIEDRSEKLCALDVLVEHLAPHRSAEVRATTEKELAATTVVRLPIVEASAKVRTGPPIDAKEDLDLPIWGGVVPLRLEPGAPIPAEGSQAMPWPTSVLEAMKGSADR